MICKNCNKKLDEPWANECPKCGAPVKTKEGNGFFDLVGMLGGGSNDSQDYHIIEEKLAAVEQELAKQKKECQRLHSDLSSAKKLTKVLLIVTAVSLVLSLAAFVGLLITSGGDYVSVEDYEKLEDKVDDLKDATDDEGYFEESKESSSEDFSEDSNVNSVEGSTEESIEESTEESVEESTEESVEDPA